MLNQLVVEGNIESAANVHSVVVIVSLFNETGPQPLKKKKKSACASEVIELVVHQN